MAHTITATTDKDEQQIMTIMHRLPPERKAQVLAFARFVAFETFEPTDLEDAYTDADARWDELLASDEGQLALDKLADEALAEIRSGIAKPMIFRS